MSEQRDPIRAANARFEDVFEAGRGRFREGMSIAQSIYRPLIGPHYIAVCDGLQYAIFALGRTADEAREAVYQLWSSRSPETEHDMPRSAFFDFYGVNVYGPIADGQAASE